MELSQPIKQHEEKNSLQEKSTAARAQCYKLPDKIDDSEDSGAFDESEMFKMNKKISSIVYQGTEKKGNLAQNEMRKKSKDQSISSVKQQNRNSNEAQKNSSQSSILAAQLFGSDLKQCVGILQCQWRKGGRNGELEIVGYATAFAIAPRIVVTCAHAIFDPKKQRVCTVAYFIPVNGQSTEDDVYETEQYDFARLQRVSKTKSYQYKLLLQDFTVFILKKSLKLKEYLKLQQFDKKPRESLQIWGYFSSSYQLTTPQIGTVFERKILSGKFIQQPEKRNNFILAHTMQTGRGHSGSPIIDFNKQNVPVVVGIHVIGGQKGVNQGLSMTKQLKMQILNWALELSKIHNISTYQQQELKKQLQDSGEEKQCPES